MKIESIACGATWVLMNALLILIIAEPFRGSGEGPRNGGADESVVSRIAYL